VRTSFQRVAIRDFKGNLRARGESRIIKNPQVTGLHKLMDIDVTEEKECQEAKPLFTCFYKCLILNEL
jgi:hypothetical protein